MGSAEFAQCEPRNNERGWFFFLLTLAVNVTKIAFLDFSRFFIFPAIIALFLKKKILNISLPDVIHP